MVSGFEFWFSSGLHERFELAAPITCQMAKENAKARKVFNEMMVKEKVDDAIALKKFLKSKKEALKKYDITFEGEILYLENLLEKASVEHMSESILMLCPPKPMPSDFIKVLLEKIVELRTIGFGKYCNMEAVGLWDWSCTVLRAMVPGLLLVSHIPATPKWFNAHF